MADEVDIANERAGFDVEVALKNLRARSGGVLIPVGKCHYCGESLPPDRSFCDADCRDDYENEQRAKVRNGRGVSDE